MQLSALKLSTLVFFTAMGWTVELLAQTPSTEEPAGTIARLSLAVTPTVGTALGPRTSISSGWNVELVRHFGIAPEIRLMWFGLHAQPSTSVDYGSQFIAQIGFSVIGFGLYRAPSASRAVRE